MDKNFFLELGEWLVCIEGSIIFLKNPYPCQGHRAAAKNHKGFFGEIQLLNFGYDLLSGHALKLYHPIFYLVQPFVTFITELNKQKIYICFAMRDGFHLGKIFGIEIDIDVSWIFIFLLVTWNLSIGLFQQTHPGWSFFLDWGLGILGSMLFFASVLAHELAHSIVARTQAEEIMAIFQKLATSAEPKQRVKTELLLEKHQGIYL